MTDTVNVPRDVFDSVLDAASGYLLETYGHSYGLNHDVDRERIFSVLAAAPKAEPDVCPRPLYDWMMERGIWPDDGPAEWPDVIQALNDHENELSQPEAPKVEQEPVAWRVTTSDGLGVFVITEKAVHTENREHWLSAGWTITPLYRHPAPASDELLEALEAEIARLRPHYQGRGLDQARVQMLDYFSDFLAKHKGPQS